MVATVSGSERSEVESPYKRSAETAVGGSDHQQTLARSGSLLMVCAVDKTAPLFHLGDMHLRYRPYFVTVLPIVWPFPHTQKDRLSSMVLCPLT